MKNTARKLVLAVLLVTLLAGSVGPTATALTRDQRRAIMRGSVLILPLTVEDGEIVDIPWSGSGTIIDASGLILTNYHVVEETGEWDILGVLVTTQSDQRPEPAYLAEIVARAPDLDLAVLQIVADNNGRAVDPRRLNLSVVPIGDADDLELGDELSIFGYPGIGQGTITLTEGKVSGFLEEEGVSYQRAWIKTDAAISGGNSGGTAVDADGYLVGIPTLASDVDVRYIADTNGDGVIDENDAAVPTGLYQPPASHQPRLPSSTEPSGDGGTRRHRSRAGGSPRVHPRAAADACPRERSSTAAAFGPSVFASEVSEYGDPYDPGIVSIGSQLARLLRV